MLKDSDAINEFEVSPDEGRIEDVSLNDMNAISDAGLFIRRIDGWTQVHSDDFGSISMSLDRMAARATADIEPKFSTEKIRGQGS